MWPTRGDGKVATISVGMGWRSRKRGGDGSLDHVILVPTLQGTFLQNWHPNWHRTPHDVPVSSRIRAMDGTGNPKRDEAPPRPRNPI